MSRALLLVDSAVWDLGRGKALGDYWKLPLVEVRLLIVLLFTGEATVKKRQARCWTGCCIPADAGSGEGGCSLENSYPAPTTSHTQVLPVGLW